MTQHEGSINGPIHDANPAGETTLCAPWILFASGQGQREEYGTTASADISAELEEEVSALCREFHNALGVQEVPNGLPVVLFWKARQSPHWIITQILRAPQQPGQRIAYEYFSLGLSEADLLNLGGNPLRALELIGPEELRKRTNAGLREPICATIVESHCAPTDTPPEQAQQFCENGTWPATPENHKALLAYLNGGSATTRTFATWWPNVKPIRPDLFDIVLRSDATRVARPHEMLAIATELNDKLSRSLPAPPSYDAVGGRSYRALLHSADEVQAMLNEAYFPAALEESPHRWMTRPQKIAGLCEKLASDLPDYATRLPEHLGAEWSQQCAEWASRYQDLARDLQKQRHPNMLHQSRGSTVSSAAPSAATGANQDQKGMRIALVLGGLLLLCLLGLGVSALIGGRNQKVQPTSVVSQTPTKVNAPPVSEEEQRDEQAIALMRARAEQEVFSVARTLAAERSRDGNGLSNDAIENTVIDAVAQAMSKTPHAQIKPAQKQLLFRLATAPIRARAMDGVREGVRQQSGARR